MISYEDLTTKTAKELIMENESIDLVLDSLISAVKDLTARIESLESGN